MAGIIGAGQTCLEVCVSELALDDVLRHALAGHLDRVCVPQLMWRKRRRTTAFTAARSGCWRTLVVLNGRPSVRP